MIAIIVITLVSFSCMFTAHHGGNRGAGGGGGSGSGRNGQPPTVSWGKNSDSFSQCRMTGSG